MMAAIPPPRTYAEWVALIERFAGGDDEPIAAMRDGRLEWAAGVAERWTKHFHEAISSRLRRLSDDLQTALDRAAGHPFAVSAAMLAARRSLRSIVLAAELPCLPEDVRDHLAAELRKFIRGTQSSLEESARRVRHDGGVLLKAIRDNPLDAAVVPADGKGEAAPPQPAPAMGRRVLL